MKEDTTQKIAAYHKAVSDPIRVKIVMHLLTKEKCVCICELAKLLERDQSVIYRHIQILQQAGIVQTHKDKNFLMSCISDMQKAKKAMEVPK